eukprot:jgi/Astpho2/8150/Aster-03082
MAAAEVGRDCFLNMPMTVTPRTRGPHCFLSERQASVELFYRLNHARQTVDFVKRQAAAFSQLDKGRWTIWEALDRLGTLREYEAALLAEPGSDMPLPEHAFQTAEACRAAFPESDWLHLCGLIHGLGKVLAHASHGIQPQWAVCGESFPVGCKFSPSVAFSRFFSVNPDRRRRLLNTDFGMYSEHCGLNAVLMSWSAAEYLYMLLVLNRVKLPPEALFVLRHQKFKALMDSRGAYWQLLSDRDVRMLPWLEAFQLIEEHPHLTNFVIEAPMHKQMLGELNLSQIGQGQGPGAQMAEDPEQLDLQDKEGRAQSKALDQLTDNVEDKQMDQSKVQSAMATLAESQKADKDAQRQRERELAALKISKGDIDAIASEFELDAKTAERRLREHRGNLRQALEALLQP